MQGFVIAYIAILLAYIAFPPPQLLFEHNEAYYPSELYAARWVANYVNQTSVIDSDHRMGVVLRYTTNCPVFLGNESSWLGRVSESKVINPVNPALEYIVITESMTRYAVTGDWSRAPNPLPSEAIRFLNNSPDTNRIYSSTGVTIYKNLNSSTNV